MPDVHTVDVRSYNMSRIRSQNTKPEIIVRKFLHKKGLRFRLNDKKLPGKPDIVLLKYNTIIFIHGCFWHCHRNCKFAKLPIQNSAYWISKLENNVRRDHVTQQKLKKEGWKIIVIWTCRLKPLYLEKTLSSILKKLLRQ